MIDITTPLYLLAFVVLTHFTFVNINIGLGVFTLILRWMSLKKRELEDVARRAFKFLVATEIVSGVFGTIITVVLAGLWTTLVNIATIVLFIPIYVSIIGIILRLTSIIGFWYTWGRVRDHIHIIIGVIMVVSSFMIPGGFRYIFAIIDYPLGLESVSPIIGDQIKALGNPIYPPLILHTLIGATSIGFFAAATGFAWASKKNSFLTEWAGKAALWGAILIIPQTIVGFWFWITLREYSRYLFRSLMGGIMRFGASQTNVSPTFFGMIILAFTLLILGFIYHSNPEERSFGYALAPLAVLTLIFGEFTHDYGRLPYMVITGDTGYPAELFVNKLVALNLGNIASGLIPILTMLLIFIGLLYLYLVKGFIE